MHSTTCTCTFVNYMYMYVIVFCVLQRENVMKLNENNHEILKYANMYNYTDMIHSFILYSSSLSSARLCLYTVYMYMYIRCGYINLHVAMVFLCRTLVVILQESQSAVAIAVAAHDLGEYVRYYPRGKR